MNPSNHGRSPLARIVLAAGGVAAFFTLAAGIYAADALIGGLRGLAAGVFLAIGVTALCGLVSRVAAPHPRLTRPAPVRLPAPATTPEPTRTAA